VVHWTEGGARIYDETPAWEDLPWIREHLDGPIVFEGIQTADDARRAVLVHCRTVYGWVSASDAVNNLRTGDPLACRRCRAATTPFAAAPASA
jgi:isopentenyl diphosphate isomerase/L-lactate dehydrogenase-like FMN-dependent dehydrogenase